jgi:hypothetical protein
MCAASAPTGLIFAAVISNCDVVFRCPYWKPKTASAHESVESRPDGRSLRVDLACDSRAIQVAGDLPSLGWRLSVQQVAIGGVVR